MDYKSGKIYCIRNDINEEIYVGSTTQSLSQRMAKHRFDSKKRTHKVYKLMNTIGIEHFYIELIEEHPCDSKEQLTKREGEVIRERWTLNIKIAGR
jgi:group I intron endonuclease